MAESGSRGSRAPQACTTEIKRIPWLFQLLHTQSILVESAVACIVRALGARRCSPRGRGASTQGRRPGCSGRARGGRAAADWLRLHQPARGEGRARRGRRSLRGSESARRGPGAASAHRDAATARRESAGSAVCPGGLPWRPLSGFWPGRHKNGQGGGEKRRGKGPRVGIRVRQLDCSWEFWTQGAYSRNILDT